MNPDNRRKPPSRDEAPPGTPSARSVGGVVARSAASVRSDLRSVATYVIVASWLSACASSSAPDYIEPPIAEASAKVRVVNTRPYAYYAAIAMFDAAACFDRANLGMTGGNSKDMVRLGMLDSKPPSSSSIERRVRAGEPLVIGPRSVFPTASMSDIMHALTPDAQEQMRARQAGVCKIPSFVPKNNEQYEVQVDLTPAHCSVKPYRLVDTNGVVQREEVPSQPTQISTYEFDMKCFK